MIALFPDFKDTMGLDYFGPLGLDMPKIGKGRLDNAIYKVVLKKQQIFLKIFSVYFCVFQARDP